MKSNHPLEYAPPDFDKMTWKCHCCSQQRQDKYIKVYSHDTSALLGLDTGSIFVNVRYCNDMPGCKDKASNREWVINRFFPTFAKDCHARIEAHVQKL